MPIFQYQFEADATGDGATSDKFLVDVSARLSELYGRLIRQGQVFKIRRIQARLYNPNTLIQDETIAVSGKIWYYHPTLYRKLAWHQALKTWKQARQKMGISQRGVDFRVGLHDGYGEAGAGSKLGVYQQCWIKDEEKPLQLTASDDEDRDIFGIWSENHAIATPNPSAVRNFGTAFARNADADDDFLDFVTNSLAYYNEEAASKEACVAPFMLNFSGWHDNADADPEDFSSATNAAIIPGPMHVMCGLIGVYVDTTIVDDSETPGGTQDWGLELHVDVESWSPIMDKSVRAWLKRGDA